MIYYSNTGLAGCLLHQSGDLSKSERGLRPGCDGCHETVTTRALSTDKRAHLSKFTAVKPGFWEEHRRRGLPAPPQAAAA